MKKIVKSDNRKSAAETEKAVKYKKDLENQTKVVSDLQSQLMAKDQKILVSLSYSVLSLNLIWKGYKLQQIAIAPFNLNCEFTDCITI